MEEENSGYDYDSLNNTQTGKSEGSDKKPSFLGKLFKGLMNVLTLGLFSKLTNKKKKQDAKTEETDKEENKDAKVEQVSKEELNEAKEANTSEKSTPAPSNSKGSKKETSTPQQESEEDKEMGA